MKKVFTLIVAAIITFSVGSVSAQSFKFGHINFGELVQAMPALAEAQTKLQAYEKDLQEVIQDTNAEYQRKVKEYEEKNTTWSDAIRASKQRELSDLMRRVQEQPQLLQQDYDKESQKLLEPIVTKAREALNKVSKANGFTYVFDMGSNVISYFNEAQSTDLLPLVKKELNIN